MPLVSLAIFDYSRSMVDRTCTHCGAGYSVPYPSTRKDYCSRRCATQQWAQRRTGELNSNWRQGRTKHPLYLVYMDMIARCSRPTHIRYADYGGRGITVCPEWRADFWQYVADVGDRPAPGMSLDRRNNDGNYEPGNVRWATAKEQRANRRPQRLSPTCGNGHEYTTENTSRTTDGKRRCKTCVRDWARQKRARLKEVTA